MRILLIVGWLFLGLGGAIFHFGPGQHQVEIDRVADVLDSARGSVEDGQYAEAVKMFNEVLTSLPKERVTESRAIVLEKAKAQMLAAQLPESRRLLESLLEEVTGDETVDVRFESEVRAALANSQYYMTWLMRLEGLPEEQWKPEIEAARQHYTQLTKIADQVNDADLQTRSSEDLESAIRLARMDIGELQGLPLPSQ